MTARTAGCRILAWSQGPVTPALVHLITDEQGFTWLSEDDFVNHFAANDEAIPPPAERQFAARMGATTVEIASSHVAMVSDPDDVTQLIEAAAKEVSAAG